MSIHKLIDRKRGNKFILGIVSNQYLIKYICALIKTYFFTHTHVHTHTYIYIYIYVYIYKIVSVYLHVCVCVYFDSRFWCVR